jgi:hypothetical protein
MIKSTGFAAVGVLCLLPIVAVEADPVNDTIDNLIQGGTADLSFRYRYETVEQDNALDDAHASTLRTRLTLKSGAVHGFSALLEADNVSTVGPDDYDSLVQDKYRGNHSVVADPVGTEINQAYGQYQFAENAGIRGGRQRILHAGQRFVGGVGWRQNEQTYDSGTFSYTGETYTLDYGYLWGVNRIFDGSDKSVQDTYFDSDSHILLGSAKTSLGTFSGFAYALDFNDAAALSSMTVGARYSGSYKMLGFDATYASQSDYGDNPTAYDADYVALEARAKIKPMTVTLGYELLGSDDGVTAFKTPLATLHKFQGWADLFLATPAGGIEDVYGGLAGSIGKVSLAAVYHDFSADEGDMEYGTEIDLVATYPFNAHIKGQIKYADYRADEYAVDTRKLWVTLMLAF